MAASTLHQHFTLWFFFGSLLVVCLALSSRTTEAQVEETGLKLMSDALEWPISMSSMYKGFDSDEDFEDGFVLEPEEDDGDGVGSDEKRRRSLFWRTVHYYISYGALTANRIPCPPRSGRSYYTHNCFTARYPVNPYTRGCSRITRCRS